MAPRRRIPAAIRRQVRIEAGDRCSYCRSPALAGVPMAVDHVIPLAAGGTSIRSNLCLACYRCNEFKGARTSGLDPNTGRTDALFHPYTQQWLHHFHWRDDGLLLIPITAVGRVTVHLLRLNDEWLQRARQIWLLAGIHPPIE